MFCYNSSKLLLFLSVLCFLSLSSLQPLGQECPNTPTYTPNSTYQANLNTLLSVLTSNANGSNGFYNFTAGGGTPDVVYGLFLCRGDISAADCQDCVVNGSKDILQSCPNQKVAIAWYNTCLLRYSNQYIFSTLDQTAAVPQANPNNVTDWVQFRPVLGKTMNGVATEAANDQSGKKFATKQANFSAAVQDQVYGLAQCTPDLSSADCYICLQNAISNLPSCCDRKTGGRVLFYSCTVEYQSYLFYNNVISNATVSPLAPVSPPPPPPPGPASSPVGGSSTNRLQVGSKLIIAFSVIVVVTLLIIMIFYLKRRFTATFWKKENVDNQNVEAFIRNYGYIGPKRYRYSVLKKITNSFKDKLGQGGYGSVYKGKLFDGRLVAVKVLSKTEGNGEDFINEVVSISRTSHVNVVNLLGFCFEGKRRALIYEFMAKGSLDKFICNNESLGTNCRLEWSTLYQIALGIARGLEYLHRGCRTRIVHFDIKPHNILLDDDLRPKISDFGLAILCRTKQSAISMLGARGTVGYVAPEVFSRTFGPVSYKSDVYSYGMMLLEMIGARDQEVEVVQTSEKYFPHWIYEHLEHDKDLRLHGVITNREEEEIVRKMILVGLWCIQTNPSDRPTMSKVVEMLEGNLQSLQIPPKPYLLPLTRANPSSQETSNSLGTLNTAEEMSEA